MRSIIELICFESMAEIGTDHGYIPIYACQTKKIKTAIACDVNQKPLETAKKNIAAAGLEACITTRLGNGLEPLAAGEAETIVIAGMGGMLILDILQKGILVAKQAKQLVLQPQHDLVAVRKWVYRNGFLIADETMVEENGKFYHMLSCFKGTESEYSETEFLVGRVLIEKKDEICKRFLLEETAKIEKIIIAVQSQGNEKASERIEELAVVLKQYKEVLKCL